MELSYIFDTIKVKKQGNEIKKIISDKINFIESLKSETFEHAIKALNIIKKKTNLEPQDGEGVLKTYDWNIYKDLDEGIVNLIRCYNDSLYNIKNWNCEINQLKTLDSLFEDKKQYELSVGQIFAITINKEAYGYQITPRISLALTNYESDKQRTQ